MVLRTLQTLGPLHGYDIARRIEQTSGNLLTVNYGPLYPALLNLEQEGYIASEWGQSDNNRRTEYHKLTRGGRKLDQEARDWEQTQPFLRVLALGAQPRDVLRLVLGEGLTVALAGILAGLAAALGLTRLMSSLLFGVSASDPVTFVVTSVALLLVALAACYMAARRAMKVDPMIALRYE